jgi:hypothetical protein
MFSMDGNMTGAHSPLTPEGHAAESMIKKAYTAERSIKMGLFEAGNSVNTALQICKLLTDSNITSGYNACCLRAILQGAQQT